ncbi:MGMT family protein [candidate division WS5 bacterium]|uniref:MGMT family protein n=1 Tax=candidate division WS5 bacterium TaxID=2093353 RepID=A0A419DFL2_9BACT|nr:MAG: MGMT family protein [candidate division WS5 bacterium]
MEKSKEVLKIVSQIPRGKVMMYGQIGKIAGIHPRLVGKILHENPDPANIPCHRVVNFKGEIAEGYAFGGMKIQSKKLIQEGVRVSGGRVDLKKYLFKRSY